MKISDHDMTVGIVYNLAVLRFSEYYMLSL